MAHATYKGINIDFNCNEFLPGRWTPYAVLTDPITGETAPCAPEAVEHSLRDAIYTAYKMACYRINSGTWRN